MFMNAVHLHNYEAMLSCFRSYGMADKATDIKSTPLSGNFTG